MNVNTNDSDDRQAALDNLLIGNSPSMQQLKQQIAQVADSDATVLIEGESGTGKELVARALHQFSHRSEASLIPIGNYTGGFGMKV